jgi:hypothetical protein
MMFQTFFPLRRFSVAAILAGLAAAAVGAPPAQAQSQGLMLGECAHAAQGYFRDYEAQTEMKYNGQRVDGTHAINGDIYLETRMESFACSYAPDGNRMVEFFAEGRVQNAFLPGNTRNSSGASGGGDVVRVTGISSGDLLNVRSGPGTNYRVIGKLGNGDQVRSLNCRMQGSSRWCEIEMMTDMRERGWVNARYLAGQGGDVSQLPSLSRVERIRFQSGTTGAEIFSQLPGAASVTYLLGARNGQTLTVELVGGGTGIEYRIFNPDNRSLLDRVASTQVYRGQLWQSGDHKIEVMNRKTTSQSFKLVVSIR